MAEPNSGKSTLGGVVPLAVRPMLIIRTIGRFQAILRRATPGPAGERSPPPPFLGYCSAETDGAAIRSLGVSSFMLGCPHACSDAISACVAKYYKELRPGTHREVAVQHRPYTGSEARFGIIWNHCPVVLLSGQSQRRGEEPQV